ncbi:hormogonium polysaccharide biosynthesis protein HpsA [Fischerella sp. JS2]|uniref:hormogonium polysaccharide biosynthesis protein HpsA n=1 Tax=Fischerella sp. JS2 TaxID=2597771 RepID=UPI0028F11952|nr:hormogonium polysaccharide biosynthesis protein HpsA [Fischerella sp. JS2]
MSPNRDLVKAIKIFYQKISQGSSSLIKEQILWLLRASLISRRQSDWLNAGFVLPTVAMVSLVVVLLTTAILFRSFERSKNASNVRVNEAVLNAATPAIDRARAKLDALFEDPTLPRGTPSDSALYDVLKKDKYRLGDETRLKLAYNFNSTTGIQTSDTIEDDETLKTAWKFAVDTDNNGKKDSYVLYGIYFRSPGRNSSGQFTRERSPLDARTPPMDDASTNQQCSTAAGFSSLVGNSSWYKLQSGNLGKSFFIYTVNVPITQSEFNSLTDQTGYEPYKGNKGFVALEFQQDRSRIPLPYNAVWYENDLEIVTGATDVKLNGRIHTNGNLLVGVNVTTGSAGSIKFRQVSSKSSCFYNQENGLISVGGNVGNGSLSQVGNQDSNVSVDLYRGFGQAIPNNSTYRPYINSTNKSTDSSGGSQIGFNDAAYEQRIAQMKSDGIALCADCQSATTITVFKSAVEDSSYPEEVKNNVDDQVTSSDDIATAKEVLAKEIEIYLRNRTRRVPFAEVPGIGATAVGALDGYTTINSLDPPVAWREPLDSDNKLRGTSINLNTSQLEATNPDEQKQTGVQEKLGDRVLVGNNLPAKWLQGTEYVGSEVNQLISSSSGSVNWTLPTSGSNANKQRWRNTQVEAIADLGISDRNGFWEEKAAENPVNPLDAVGGVRIVTGAGIYVDGSGTSDTTNGPFYGRQDYSFLPDPPDPTSADNTDIPVWSDTMPMTSANSTETRKGDLLMRATAVYHYKIDSGTDQEPVACVSSYYDPTNTTTAQNQNALPWNANANGKSNNGIVYDFPGRSTFTTYKARLQRQAKLKFPSGRWVNEPLKNALDKIGTATTVPSTGLQLEDYSAIDTALCSISILAGATPSTSLTNKPPHGAIKEASFLDGREAKQISTSSSTSVADLSTSYDLDLEQRQPLEIRVTDIDLGMLADTTITQSGSTAEYFLPYSGIIYASREDALVDQSNSASKSLSSTDFKLDPTRRPNGVRLINGVTLARKPSTNNNAYNAKEKGLILVSNVPTYIKDKFNLHRSAVVDDATTVGVDESTTEIEEFTETELGGTDFYNRSTPNTKFACRIGRTGCSSTTGNGDYWRPATIIADSMTLLSGGFKDGFRSDSDYDLNNNIGTLVTSQKADSTYNDTYFATLDPVSRNIVRNRLKNGFWENSFATSADWWTPATGTIFPKTTMGSYVKNGITPIQRRVNANPMYVMEICRKDLVSECQPGDWYIGFDIDGDGALSNTPQNYTIPGTTSGTTTTVTLTESQIKSYQLGQAIIASYNLSSPSSSPDTNSNNILTNSELGWTTAFTTSSNSKNIRQRLGAGDTGSLALVETDRRYPRRVAFARNDSNQLVTVSATATTYKPMGVGCPVYISTYISASDTNYRNNGCTYASSPVEYTNYGMKGDNSLWFRGTSNTSNPPNPTLSPNYETDRQLFYYPPIDGDDADTNPDLDGQPRLVPVLQIHDANSTPTDGAGNARGDTTSQDNFRLQWLQVADASTTFNATFVVGNSPSRPEEISAGLQNLVRFLESWYFQTSNPKLRTVRISGSFIQLQRSTYATAPLAPVLETTGSANTTTNNYSLFKYAYKTYPTPNLNGLSPFYNPPDRNWGFDVGLLSEQPDLFAQRFTMPPTGRPNEFFREVGRDDAWVQTLLCAGQASNQTGIPESGTTVTYSRAVPTEYRPSSCPSIPNDS